MLDNVIGWVKKLTEVGVSFIALAVVVQIIFGSQAAFLPGDIIARLTDIIVGLGAANLVGLIAVGLLYKIFTK
ncbi:hypothetical protein N9Q65_02070 [Candidatus Thioglobus sp.]|jgi:hypothetical protein|uniref:hypothetical protein n=1 Tax=unclassified Candidatus Pseudothioglobus TaxID=3072908 RepID=UPI002304A6D0|nr:hypothetical protein [Candidatus Thioglobus sp.]MDA9057973.1 hypothetical protein [Candidatus Thioglobus sp.]MDA9060250.1 hypothetical protein [Candidatus Thioglobus sp.]MDA9319670.1 hypothetical protein [Candidatus Thioglobus sp.]MDA9871856.1 hypothetical protein [Candidatus Thioglobus sp.]MDB4026529.1 hypothetical protein [Candidatus Thioglobus sp.]|tara:strand:- start:906 stop:1124 length:219 start_codon:yes stop_codon:yes gene_type:complete